MDPRRAAAQRARRELVIKTARQPAEPSTEGLPSSRGTQPKPGARAPHRHRSTSAPAAQVADEA
eukprot:5199635-Alexandrium_andersonii.AAC.1